MHVILLNQKVFICFQVSSKFDHYWSLSIYMPIKNYLWALFLGLSFLRQGLI